MGCVEALSDFLEEARNVYAVWTFPNQARVTRAEWRSHVVDAGRRFHRLGLPDKLERLSTDYGPSAIPGTAANIMSINAARNCLVHRGGTVSNRDANTAEGLRATWLKHEIMVVDSSGTETTIASTPFTVEGPATLRFRQSEATKLFRLGEPITFTSQEFNQLCWTFFRFGEQVVSAVTEYGKHMGIRFGEAETAAAVTSADANTPAS